MIKVEQNILGAILMDGDLIGQLNGQLKPEMFEYSLHQDVFREMLESYDRNEPIEITSIAQKIANKERTEEFIAEQLHGVFHTIADDVFSEKNMPVYVKTLINDYKARQITKMLERVDVSAGNIDDTIGELMTQLETLQGSEQSESKSFKEIVEENKGNYFKETVGKDKIKTGFYRLDEMIGGLEKGDVTVVAARPACGKSAFATQIVRNVAEQGYYCGYFNLEMRESQIYERLVSQKMSHPDGITRLRRAVGFNTDEEKEEFAKINDYISNFNGRLISTCFTLESIKRECKNRKFDVVVIDYLQIITSDRRYDSRNAEIGAISRQIKEMAMKLNMHVILLSQFNRASESRQDKEPMMSDLRESGAIEQDASNIIAIWNLNKDKPRYKGVKVDKSRQSQTGKIGMCFDGAHMLFTERLGEFYQWEKEARGDSNNLLSDEDVVDAMFS